MDVTFWELAAQTCELYRVLQKLHNLLQLGLCLINSVDIRELKHGPRTVWVDFIVNAKTCKRESQRLISASNKDKKINNNKK